MDIYLLQDKYRYDSERADVPSRPVDAELETPVSPIILNHHDCINRPSTATSQRSLYECSTPETQFSNHLSPTTSKEHLNPQVVRRDTVVKRFEMQSSRFENGKFHNPWRDYKSPTFTNILKLGLSSDKSNVSPKQVFISFIIVYYIINNKNKCISKDLSLSLPLLVPNIKEKAQENTFRVTWIGHSTILAEMDNISVLTDPIFSERASPSQVFGPKRYRDPPCTVSV